MCLVANRYFQCAKKLRLRALALDKNITIQNFACKVEIAFCTILSVLNAIYLIYSKICIIYCEINDIIQRVASNCVQWVIAYVRKDGSRGVFGQYQNRNRQLTFSFFRQRNFVIYLCQGEGVIQFSQIQWLRRTVSPLVLYNLIIMGD